MNTEQIFVKLEKNNTNDACITTQNVERDASKLANIEEIVVQFATNETQFSKHFESIKCGVGDGRQVFIMEEIMQDYDFEDKLEKMKMRKQPRMKRKKKFTYNFQSNKKFNQFLSHLD